LEPANDCCSTETGVIVRCKLHIISKCPFLPIVYCWIIKYHHRTAPE
jgi:hypothetical protein